MKKLSTLSAFATATLISLSSQLPMTAQDQKKLAPPPTEAAAPAKKNIYSGLIDHNGKPVTSETFGGRLQLVFLGFTSCPTICPKRINDLNTALKQMKPEDSSRAVITFITIDPENDTPERLKAYIGDRPIIGLTGKAADIENIKKFFGERGNKQTHMGLTYLVSGNNVITALPFEDSPQKVASRTTGCLDMCGLPPAKAPTTAPAGP